MPLILQQFARISRGVSSQRRTDRPLRAAPRLRVMLRPWLEFSRLSWPSSSVPGSRRLRGRSGRTTGPPGAVVQSIAADPTSNSVLYAGTRNGGVFKAEPGGPTTWRAANTGLAKPRRPFDCKRRPATSGVVLAGTDAGIYRTANGGESWGLVPGPPAEPIDEIAFDRTAPATVYAVSFAGWIGKSTNGGASWQALGGPAASSAASGRDRRSHSQARRSTSARSTTAFTRARTAARPGPRATKGS